MRIIKLAWVGNPNRQRPNRPSPSSMTSWASDWSWTSPVLDAQAPDGSKVEVFGPDSLVNRHFTTGPVAGFLVDDVQAATAELRSAGVEILFDSGLDDSGNGWVHFRAPDGNIYEFTQDPGISRPH